MRTNSNSLMSTTPELTTDRLTLRPWRVDDAQAALDVYTHAAVLLHLRANHEICGAGVT